jgi:predicted nucleic acid-binding protein
VIDTNILIYDTFEDSLHHKEAAKLLDELDRWLIPLIVLYEFIWFLKGLSVSVIDARDKLLEYTTCRNCAVIREGMEDVKWASSLLLEEKLSLSRFNDKIVLSLALHKGIPLATYDLKLRSQAAELGVPLLPKNV